MPWNFAYGSNMHPDRLRARAQIEPTRCEPAVLRNWRLAFNLATGLSWAEPSMANIVPAPGEAVHGVALEMTEAELDRLRASEGGTRWYRCVSLDLETYAGEHLTAKAFVAREDVVRNEVPPSGRYLRLLREGARHHQLAADYRALLDAHAEAPPSAWAPWMLRLIRILDEPRSRPRRDALMWLFHNLARLEARLARRRGRIA